MDKPICFASRRSPVRSRLAPLTKRLGDAPGRQPNLSGLHELDEAGRPVAIAHGVMPSMHSFRHAVANRALLAAESIDEVAFMLGRRDANVIRAVYLREMSDARRRPMRRSRMIAEFGDVLGLQEAD